MTDHQPPPAVELPINDPTNPAHRLADDLRRGRIPGYAAEDVRLVLESLRHSVERETLTDAAIQDAAVEYFPTPGKRQGELANKVSQLQRAFMVGAGFARAALDRRAGT